MCLSQAYSVVTVDPLTSSSYGAFARRPATVSDTRSRRSRRSKGSVCHLLVHGTTWSQSFFCNRASYLCSHAIVLTQSGLGLRERDPNRPHSVSGSRSSGDSFFERASSRNSSRNSTGDQKPHELDAAGSTGWRFRSGGFREKPRYRTQGEMQEARAKAMLPDPSFDVDGDGVVSSTDYYLSSQFDVDKDGHIDDDERAALRKTMVDALVRKYRAVPKVENKETAEMIKMFTKDLDRTVNKSTFMQDFNKLCDKFRRVVCPLSATNQQLGWGTDTRKRPRHKLSTQRRYSAYYARSRCKRTRSAKEAPRHSRITRRG